jgi:putative ABC transport system permease protein
MQNLWQDLRYAIRVLIKSPSFTSIAILTLALGIGANTAIFTIVYGVLLRPLPFPHPERLVQLAESYKQLSDDMSVDTRELRQLQRYNKLFDHICGFSLIGYNLATGNAAEHLPGMPVDADYFRLLGVPPGLGRDFVDDDNKAKGQRVAIISHALWTRRFASDVQQIGSTILLNGEPFTLIGVMPREFASIPPADVWTPLALVADTVGSGGNIDVLARLKPGVTRGELDAQMALVTQDFRRDYPNVVGKELVMSFLPYQTVTGLEVRSYLFILLGAIGFVLLIACANVANLLLARGGSRQREIAVRIAMGASRSRLFQQLLTESVVIALAGGALGLLLAYAGLSSLLALAPIELPRATAIHLDFWAFAFTLGISLLTGILFGLAPAQQYTGRNVNETLKAGEGRSSSGASHSRLRQVLIVAEFAISLVLLTGASLMIATFSKLLHTDPGFNPHSVLTLQFWLIGSKYNSTPQIDLFNRAVVQRLQSLPGVEAAGTVAAGLPLERGGNNGARIPGPHGLEAYNVDYREISLDYMRAIGMPLRQGRLFAETDSGTSSPVAIINEQFAKKYFSQGNALGQHVIVSQKTYEIVGVVGDVKSYLDQPARPTVFLPDAQASYETSAIFEGWYPRAIVLRTSGDPLRLSRAMRDAVAAVDPGVPTGKLLSMDERLSRSLALRSFMMQLLSLFAGMALILASVGIYGVISYAVSQRTREIGVRMALGARPNDVLRLVLTEGLKLVIVGVVIGIASALALTRLIATLLYGVKATDPLIFLGVVAVLVGIALAACYMPARRAMRVDPIVALRYE